MATKPTHEQAQLHLQVYEQRREARLRQARDWFFKNYFVENFDDSMRIAAPGTENGTHAMMVLSYWEQACALLDYGRRRPAGEGTFQNEWLSRTPGESRAALRGLE